MPSYPSFRRTPTSTSSSWVHRMLPPNFSGPGVFAAPALAVSTGVADAWVSVGHTGAAVTAAVLACGKVTGMTRPACAVVLPAIQGPVVLVDAGAFLDASPETLTQVAIAGWSYARTLGVPEPKVGLLYIGHEPGKGDELRSLAYEGMPPGPLTGASLT